MASAIRTASSMYADRPQLDSWIEVSSRPSSSSLSSVADEIITTGLRVRQDPTIPRRRRRLRRSLPDNARLGTQSTSRAVTSSQEEYDESDSESDQVLSSSNEAVRSEVRGSQRNAPADMTTSTSSRDAYASGEDEYDDNDNATAIGTTGGSAFRPQPNAFSHPPLSRAASHSVPNQRPARSAYQRHSYQSQPQHSPFNAIAPSHQVDHDAALRASLSTLLSYAAATRNIPKSGGQGSQVPPPNSNRIDTTTIGLVPESVALGGMGPSTVEEQSVLSDKGKRKAVTATATGTTARSSSKDRRAAKKQRRGVYPVNAISGLEEVSPTLLTWVMGAGMLVLVSAISFSAGYVVGRETGHAEAATSMSSAGASVVKRELVAAKGGGLGLRRVAGAAVGA
ncbi:hypothetical protein BT63DRAFT_435642 [Microthyrium microscopicum]|uniref:REJ domain-containing protein n=1 Tax=Microthyrium microscopicum TaxID=703497 RepID=A0A6A6UQI1_9PEZI|nr:hypothetical protein BT63DRAFT_435642 [Microthyrium microscopicum]